MKNEHTEKSNEFRLVDILVAVVFFVRIPHTYNKLKKKYPQR